MVCLSHTKRKPVFRFPTGSDTNRALQPQKKARGLNFWILELDGLFYLCSDSSCVLPTQLICTFVFTYAKGGSVAKWFVRWTTKLATPGLIPGSDGTTDWLFSAGW